MDPVEHSLLAHMNILALQKKANQWFKVRIIGFKKCKMVCICYSDSLIQISPQL